MNDNPSLRNNQKLIRLLPESNQVQQSQSYNSQQYQQQLVNQNIVDPNVQNINLVQPTGISNIQVMIQSQQNSYKPFQNQLTQVQNYQQNQIQITQYQEEIKILKQLLEKQKDTVLDQEEQISKFKIIQKNIENYKQQIDEQENQIYTLQQQNEELESQLIRSKRQEIIFNQKDQQITLLNNQKQDLLDQIVNLKKQQTEFPNQNKNHDQNSTQQEQISQLIEKNQQLQMQNFNYLEQINNKESLFQILVDQKNQKQQEIDILKKQIIDLNKQTNPSYIEYQKQLDEYQNEIYQKNKIINNLKDQIQNKDVEIQNLILDLKQIKDQNKHLISINELLNNSKNSEKAQAQNIIFDPEILKQQKQERQQRQIQSENMILDKIREQEQLQKQQQKEQQKKQMIGLQTKLLEEYGVIQICFVIDTTGSMEVYKEQVLLCISETIQQVKDQINYKIQWACVAYQDFKELKLNNNKYNELNFTENEKYLEKFLNQQKCIDGEDFAEDIKGAFKQMLNLQWTKSFKLVMLICDAPTHGDRYNGGMPDNHPKQDIEPELNQIIDRDIFLVATNFVRYTEPMFAEFENIFKKNKKEHLLTLVDLKKADKSTLWKQLKSIISDAAVKATQSNNSLTYGKQSKIAQKNQNNDSATQAILKAGDPYYFEKIDKIKVENASVQIYSVRFQENLINKKELLTKVDELKKIPIITIKEGKWECIKTEYPFAYGMIKQVYLLKKNNKDDELYVIKAPIGREGFYTNINDAAQDCRTHLLSQIMFDLFRQQLREKSQEKNQQQYQVVNQMKYTDLLILEQKHVNFHTVTNKYFIAERFFNGEFKKYNNNFGFIEKEKSIINEIAQAFSLFSYQTSSFSYILCDIQGIGNYFTDPAICTHTGNFDETDMGIEGQAKYMLTYENRKQDFRDITQTLDIEID